MPNYICATCGNQFGASDDPPASCPICQDERQYVGLEGQQWLTLESLAADHHNEIRELEPGLSGIGTTPDFAIGQRALLVQADGGNVLWDCISLIDAPTIAAIEALGGVSAIAISHPHFYASMVEWSRAFDAPVFLHADDRDWVMRADPAIEFWEGESRQLQPGVTLVRCGGHFPGSTVLHWSQGSQGRGVLLSADTLQVVADRRYVSFMYSYPNLIPLPADAIVGINRRLEPYSFDRIYGGWWDRIVSANAKQAVKRSVDRYIRALQP